MLKVGFFLRDDAVPRTEYWRQFQAQFGAAAEIDGDADLLIPYEDTAIETNWPRYGDPASAYVRGKGHDLGENGGVIGYLRRIAQAAARRPSQKFLYVNMHPFFRVPLMLRQRPNVIVADVSLATFERDLNRNTISMPALPVIAAPGPPAGPRPILASFQGVNSHPVRQAMAKIADQKTFVVNFVGRDRHVGKIDAVNARTDAQYEQLLAQSVFAFVPRGDALFSYRLLEAMSFGCIPIILSDGWVLPFDRTLRWDEFAIRIHAEAVQHLPGILSGMTREEIAARQAHVNAVYRAHLADLGKIVATMLAEAEMLCQRDAPAAPAR